MKLDRRAVVQPAIDAALIEASWLFALLIAGITAPPFREFGPSVALASLATAITLAIGFRRGLYTAGPALPRTEEISVVFGAAAASAGFLALVVPILDWRVSARELLLGAGVAFLSRSIGRSIVHDLGRRFPWSGRTIPVVVVSNSPEVSELIELIGDHPESRLRLLGLVGNQAPDPDSGLADLWLGPMDSLVEIMHLHQAQAVVVSATGVRSSELKSLTSKLFSVGFDVHLSPGVSHLQQGRISTRSLSHEPLIVLGTRQIRTLDRAVKRVFDVVAGSVLLLCCLPLFALIAVAIRLDSKGKVFFPSPRFGRDAQPFSMWKFRSMVDNAAAMQSDLASENQRSGPLFKIAGDPRITRVGKILRETSMDELPQLINVIRGEMSLVGPRPATPEEESAFSGDYRKRFVVRPGITGLWQVEARTHPSFNAYRRLDLQYLENWSLGLDLRILLATFEQVFASLLLLPLQLVFRQLSVDVVVETEDDPSIIDLRQRSRARFGGQRELAGAQTKPSQRANES